MPSKLFVSSIAKDAVKWLRPVSLRVIRATSRYGVQEHIVAGPHPEAGDLWTFI